MREILVKKLVTEMHLDGLDERSSLELLESKDVDESLSKEIYRMTKGHPLSLEIIAIKKHDLKEQIIRKFDIDIIMEYPTTFCNSEIFEDLDEDEIELLKIASVFRTPVPLDAFLINKKIRICSINC